MEKPHKKLNVWNAAMDLVLEVYHATDAFPREERYSLTDQLRRATVSVPCNIAEGAARNTRKEFVQFLHMAQGSLSEVDTQLEIAKRLSYLHTDYWTKLDDLVWRIDKMLSGLIRHQKRREHNPTHLTPHS